ncbi:MAG: bifunctional aminoglycoside phosphotransferase/ATP-binding protein [Thermoleophilaceae bacterium]
MESADAYERVRVALADPAFYPHAPEQVAVIDTHTSCVFLAGELAYKLKKPVRFGFLDYGSADARHMMCREEVRLNRRLAPRLYLGVRSVVEAPGGLELAGEDAAGALEHVLEMCRFDERRTIASRLRGARPTQAEIGELGSHLAHFHLESPPVRRMRDPGEAIRSTTGETFSSLRRLLPQPLRSELLAAERFTSAYLAARGGLLLERARAGCVRDGHGDLRADHVLLGDPIEIVDCVEFDPALRQIDMAEDLAFLVMDLHRLAAPDLAGALTASYRHAGGDPGDDGLLAFHSSQRALVRAKVALLRNGAADVEDLLRLSRRFRWQARAPLLLALCGRPGSGKTFLASALGKASGFPVLSSDVTRKRLAGLRPGQRALAEHYRASFSRRTYAALGEQARAELEHRGGAVVDATFRRRSERELFMAVSGARVLFVECAAPLAVRRERLRQRVGVPGQASDATQEVARRQLFAPLDEVGPDRHLILRSDREVGELRRAVEAWLDDRPSFSGA